MSSISCASSCRASKSKIVLYSDKEPLFDRHGIEEKVQKALDRRVWLRSGGYIIIERTEALTAIDVNTGRFVGKRNQEETILRTNMDAVHEVVRQLRLRNVGGIIIIDFIDMEKEANRKKVYDALKEALKKDKARTNILKISELGLGGNDQPTHPGKSGKPDAQPLSALRRARPHQVGGDRRL